MRISVNHEVCSGHGRCASVAPDVYTLDDNGYNAMDDTEVEPGKEDRARIGADNCPERAITLIP